MHAFYVLAPYGAAIEQQRKLQVQGDAHRVCAHNLFPMEKWFDFIVYVLLIPGEGQSRMALTDARL